jgi:hypothetical protein
MRRTITIRTATISTITAAVIFGSTYFAISEQQTPREPGQRSVACPVGGLVNNTVFDFADARGPKLPSVNTAEDAVAGYRSSLKAGETLSLERQSDHDARFVIDRDGTIIGTVDVELIGSAWGVTASTVCQ